MRCRLKSVIQVSSFGGGGFPCRQADARRTDDSTNSPNALELFSLPWLLWTLLKCCSFVTLKIRQVELMAVSRDVDHGGVGRRSPDPLKIRGRGQSVF